MKNLKRVFLIILSLSLLIPSHVSVIAAEGETGLKATFYKLDNPDITLKEENITGTAVVDNINYDNNPMADLLKANTGGAVDYTGIRFTGCITFPEDGEYRFNVKTDDGHVLFVDGQIAATNWKNSNAESTTKYKEYKGGVPYHFQLDYANAAGHANAVVKWQKYGGEAEVVPASAFTQSDKVVVSPELDPITKIYTVADAHLDTMWNWPLEKTVEEYIPKTLNKNFELIEKYPDYKFNFEGAARYELIREYYPEAWEKLKDYIAKGRWFAAGSSWESNDLSVQSSESLFRNLLYGNQYFADMFGNEHRTKDIWQADFFGSSNVVPSVGVHSNLNSTAMKGIKSKDNPFNGATVGTWTGPDGATIAVADTSKTGGYGGNVTSDIRTKYANGIIKTNSMYGFNGLFMYHGTGDTGGSPKEESVKSLQDAIDTNEGNNVQVIAARSDWWANELTPEQWKSLPNIKYDLSNSQDLGVATSISIGKRWNAHNEKLATKAEHASTAAAWVGARAYPIKIFNEAWQRVLLHTFHDDIAGTSTADVKLRSWNDYMISLKQFKSEYESALSGMASAMDTTPAILILTPILLPIVTSFGMDSVHFGVMMVVNLAIGFVTPPIGVNLFVASSLTDVPVMDIAKKAMPMILMFLVALLLITFIPAISLVLL